MADTPQDCGGCRYGEAWLERRQADNDLSCELGNGLVATIVWLPRYAVLPHDSMAHEQLDQGAFNHPCIIIKRAACGHNVFCIPITSWGGQGFQKKHDGLRRQHVYTKANRYMVIEHPNMEKLNNYGTLEHSGSSMPNASYAVLEEGFWIEWQFLESYGARRLTSQALAKLLSLTSGEEASRKKNVRQSPTRRRSPPLTVDMAPPGLVRRMMRPPPTPSSEASPQQQFVWPVQQLQNYAPMTPPPEAGEETNPFFQAPQPHYCADYQMLLEMVMKWRIQLHQRLRSIRSNIRLELCRSIPKLTSSAYIMGWRRRMHL